MPVFASERFAVEALPGRDERGDPILVVVAKRTYRLDPDKGACTLDGIEAQPPIHVQDLYDDAKDPLDAEMIEDGELAPFKPRADVIVRGKAYAPRGEAVPQFEVSVRVGGLEKRLRITGPRKAVWRPPQKETAKEMVPSPPLFTDPQPIRTLPLSWRHAWGGRSPLVPWMPAKAQEAAGGAQEPVGPIPCPFNPIGKGFATGFSREAIDGLDLPCIEDPKRPLTPEQVGRDLATLLDWDVLPAGFGPVSRVSLMRASFFGLDPVEAEAAQARLDEQVVGMDPDDPEQVPVIESLLDFKIPELDGRYHNAAPPDQQVDALRGDEAVRLENLDPKGTTAFDLPGHAPVVTLDRGRGLEPVAPRLDTLVIDREACTVTLVWRGRLRLSSLEEFSRYAKFDLAVVEVGAGMQEDEIRRIRDAQGWEPPSDAPPAAPEPDAQAQAEQKKKAREIARKKAALLARLRGSKESADPAPSGVRTPGKT